MKGLGRHHPELLRLLLREPSGETWPRRRRLRFRNRRIGSRFFFTVVNVVRFGGPAEQRGPPAGGGVSPAFWIGPAVAGSGRGFDSGGDGCEGGGHFGNFIFLSVRKRFLGINVPNTHGFYSVWK